MQQGEPSLEEILASIRKVMAPDSANGGSSSTAAEASEDEPGKEGEAVEAEEPGDILELEAHMLIAETPEAGEPEWTEPGLSFVAADHSPDSPGESPVAAAELARRDAAAAVRESLAALERLSDAHPAPPPSPPIDPALEGLARETLRPMLAQWLEANLPAIVERMVQEEIARIVGRRS